MAVLGAHGHSSLVFGRSVSSMRPRQTGFARAFREPWGAGRQVGDYWERKECDNPWVLAAIGRKYRPQARRAVGRCRACWSCNRLEAMSGRGPGPFVPETEKGKPNSHSR